MCLTILKMWHMEFMAVKFDIHLNVFRWKTLYIQTRKRDITWRIYSSRLFLWMLIASTSINFSKSLSSFSSCCILTESIEVIWKLYQRKVMKLLNGTLISSQSPLAEISISLVVHFNVVTPWDNTYRLFSQTGISHATPPSRYYHTGCKLSQLIATLKRMAINYQTFFSQSLSDLGYHPKVNILYIEPH